MIRGPIIDLALEDYFHIDMINVHFPLSERFGYVDDIKLELHETTLVSFYVYPFPWNYIGVNGNMLNTRDLPLYEGFPFAVLDPGIYQISYSFQRDYALKRESRVTSQENQAAQSAFDVRVSQIISEQISEFVGKLTIDMAEEQNRRFLLEGWHGLESESFRWTSESASFRFASNNLMPVTMDVIAYTFPYSGETSVYANGQYITAIRPEGSERVIIPVEALNSEGLQQIVTLRNTNARSPSEVSDSPDTRILGIQCFEIILSIEPIFAP
jgi:hypothetical protein